MKGKNKKLLEDNIGKYLHELVGREELHKQDTKDTLTIMKGDFCSSKNNTKSEKINHRAREGIFNSQNWEN